MVIDFSKIDLKEQPTIILKDSMDTPIGVLGNAFSITPDLKFDEMSTVTFNIPKCIDGKDVPFYDYVTGMKVIEIADLGQFVLVNPIVNDDGVKTYKSCTAHSLEYEFTFKKITVQKGTYNFWNPVSPEGTILGIILELMPSWGVGTISPDLIGKYRTFEVSDENVYNFIKNTLQTSYSCIFSFDTFNRRINVIDVASLVPTNTVYLSTQNLVKSLTVEESTENIVTRLDVNGADGITIRDVNPTGNNKIINLDHFMTIDNFSQETIDKYNLWKTTYANYQLPYYNLSIEYSLQVMRKVTEETALVELRNDLTVLENEQAVTIQSIAMGLSPQLDLDKVNEKISAKQAEINAKVIDVENVQQQVANLFSQLGDINNITKFESFFNEAENIHIDRFIKEDSISESSFVAESTSSYSSGDYGNTLTSESISISGADIVLAISRSDKNIYDITGGNISSSFVDAEIIKSAFEIKPDKTFVMTAYLSKGVAKGGDLAEFETACLSLTGTASSTTTDAEGDFEQGELPTGTYLNITGINGFLYFTLNASEYESRAVAWDLFQYGSEILEKVSQPSYTFKLSSSNFLAADDFIKFKNNIKLGERIYVDLGDGSVLEPICVAIAISYENIETITLEFSSTYVSSDASFLLADLLDQSVSMGKSVDTSKFNYSAFIDSGASSEVKSFMTSALDVSKNAILSSKDQAISWGDSGIRLRKWADDAKTIYDDKQVWLNNNSILMTNNNWATAELAIGNFNDPNLGDMWGIVAPNIVGTLLAGSSLVIESAKKSGDTSVFKVDGEGCFLYNSDFNIISNDVQISLNPEHGIVIGKYPVYKDESGTEVVNEDNAKFWVDLEGNLFFEGTLRATTGEFSGRVTALEGYIGQPSSGWEIGSMSIYNGKESYISNEAGIYIGTDGVSIGSGGSYIRMNPNGTLSANNVTLTGYIRATSGEIGGAIISNGLLQISNANITSLSADKISGGTISGSIISGGTINGNTVDVTNISASNITTGTLDANRITVVNLDADSITSGTISADRISGGTISANLISGGTINATNINVTNLNGSNITQGTVPTTRLNNEVLTTSDISTSGRIDAAFVSASGGVMSNGTIRGARIEGGTIVGTVGNGNGNIYCSQINCTAFQINFQSYSERIIDYTDAGGNAASMVVLGRT